MAIFKSNPCQYDIDKILFDMFGYNEFRLGQREVIESILSGKDTIAIFPTGGGKSLCFQIPALIFPGTSIVISPLISLMKDQVDDLVAKQIPATYISSLLHEREVKNRIREIKAGRYKIVYIAPERFYSKSFIDALKGIYIPFVAVDEAHCISQWGHNFRPAYLKIKDFVRYVGNGVTAAFTATANKKVQGDIATLLGMSDSRLFIASFDRPNLEFRIEDPPNNKKYIKDLITFHPDKPMIVYASTRKNVEDIFYYLRNNGINVGMYHGGLSSRMKNMYQEQFVSGQLNVIVATNAFGMGIDKRDVRFIVHYNMPKSIENYYQEAGRAGRDGKRSVCILLKNDEDYRINKYLIDCNYPPLRKVKRLFKKIKKSAESGLYVKALVDKDAADYRINESALRKLVEYEYISIRNGIAYTEEEIKFDLTQTDINEHKKIELDKLDSMIQYAEGNACLRGFILDYFNETNFQPPCNNCSTCKE